jgi:AraC-like DNA-binding protein
MAEILQYQLDVDKRSRWQIVTVHPLAKSELIYAQEVGDFYCGRNYYTVREGLDSFLIKLTLSGGGILEYEGKEYHLSAGQFFWIDCQNSQRYYTDPKHGRWHVLWIHFRGGNAKAYYDLFRSIGEGNPIGSMPAQCNGEDLLKELIFQYMENTSTIDNDITASSKLTQLLAFCIQAVSGQEESNVMPDVVQQIRAYLSEHYAESIQLDSLSQQFSVSKYHLQRIFKKYVGQSPLEFLSSVRLTHAKELLRTTDLPISEIAYRVGMENASYFISKFRSEEEITPNKYRKHWSNG